MIESIKTQLPSSEGIVVELSLIEKNDTKSWETLVIHNEEDYNEINEYINELVINKKLLGVEIVK